MDPKLISDEIHKIDLDDSTEILIFYDVGYFYSLGELYKIDIIWSVSHNWRPICRRMIPWTIAKNNILKERSISHIH